jgi:hypothetical protein
LIYILIVDHEYAPVNVVRCGCFRYGNKHQAIRLVPSSGFEIIFWI